jgi:hypothetical protein
MHGDGVFTHIGRAGAIFSPDRQPLEQTGQQKQRRSPGADEGKKGFYASFQYVTLIGGQLLAVLVVVALQQVLSALVPYSPPTDSPWNRRANRSNAGAQVPMTA